MDVFSYQIILKRKLLKSICQEEIYSQNKIIVKCQEKTIQNCLKNAQILCNKLGPKLYQIIFNNQNNLNYAWYFIHIKKLMNIMKKLSYHFYKNIKKKLLKYKEKHSTLDNLYLRTKQIEINKQTIYCIIQMKNST